MAKNNSGVVIHRVPNPNNKKPKPKANPPRGSNKEDKKPATATKQFDEQYRRNIKILALFLAAFAFFIFIALISYSSTDEAFLDIRAKDLLGLIRADDEVIARAEKTNNFLGLIGAFIANYLYNSTFGLAVLVFPIVLFYWAFELFKYQRIQEKTYKYTSFVAILALTFAGLMGTISKVWIPDMPKELSGTVGYYISSVLYSILGSFGSLLLYAFTVFATFFWGFKFEFTRTKNALNKVSEMEIDKDKVKDKLSFITSPYKAIRDYTRRDSIDGDDDETNTDPTDDKPITKSSTINKPAAKQAVPNSKAPINQAITDEEEPLQTTINFPNENTKGAARTILQTMEFTHQAEQYLDDEDSYDVVEDEPFIGVRNPNSEPAPTKPINIDFTQKAAEETYPLEDEIPPYTKEVILDTPIDDIDEPHEDEQYINEAETITPPQVHINEAPTEIMHPEPAIAATPVAPVAGASSATLNLYVSDPLENEEVAHIPPSLISTTTLNEDIKFTPPNLDLLNVDNASIELDEEELQQNALTLKEKLATFRIEIDNLSITPGPVVTQYEFTPAEGVRVSSIANLSDDIAMALKAKGIRIIAPVPGKGTVGIEIPNKKPQMVRFSSLLKSPKFQDNQFLLPIALGKTISGEVYISDLSTFPHLLIAGATGSGKSVGINTIMASLLYKLHPRDLKFVIIDPKKVELNQYRALENHYLAISPDLKSPIITEPQDAIVVLNALCKEMDNRYYILADAKERNIKDYNKKIDNGSIKDTDNMIHRRMPYIVCIVDELADLMLTGKKEVETPIIRLTQLARAVGIHLVVATQRPSVNVITGLIKSNIPARASYLVATKIDSRTILDMIGAEKLLGNGDMLFAPAGATKPLRIQNAFISTDEVGALCDFIGAQQGYSEPYMLPSIMEEPDEMDELDAGDRDALFADAARIVVNLQNASVSLLQRRLGIGYARAGKIIDQLEAAGIIGPHAGSKSRDVYLSSEADLEAYI